MIRVFLLVTDLQAGGTPLRVVRWARWLREVQIDPIVCCLAPRGPLHDELDRLGIPNAACGARGRFDLTALWRLRQLLRRFRPDVIHSFLFHANLAARIVGCLDRPRPIITSTATVETQKRWHRRLETLTIRRSWRHVVAAPAVHRHALGDLHVPPRKLVLIPNGVDVTAIDRVPPMQRASFGCPDDAPLITWVGRMDPVKDLRTWIKVFQQVGRRTAARGLLIGDGPERPGLLAALRTVDLLCEAQREHPIPAGRVRWIGWQASPAAYLKASDVLLFTSLTEGSPNVVLEAMAAGCAVVATRAGGVEDLVQHGRTGWLCPVGDIDALTQAVFEAISQPDQRSAVARAAYDWVCACESPSETTRRLKNLYAAANFFRADPGRASAFSAP